jgi:tetratricopeptide (TPR) repeat protein
MAPFHYLYGTTLLYSIEESTDLQQQMTNAVGGQAEEADDEADDSQIAWENLEIARAILEKMLQTPREEQPLVEQKLRVDLAQVLVREGDLQRQNGRYEQAVADYTSCLQLREGDSGLGPYDRKIADVHYQLGLTYTLMAAETKAAAPPEQQRGEQQRPVVPEEEDTDRKRAFYRSRSFHHFVECSKAFAGQIAVLCGVDPVGLLKRADSDIPKFKSTGEEEQEDDVDHPKIAGLKLASLRKHLGQLTPPIAEQSTYTDLCMLLEEIQETVDEAENAEKGVHQVAEMKEQITAAVAAQAGQAAEAPAGGETGAAAGGETTVGFGSAAAAANTAAAKPVMMVVKKKMKKRDTPEDEGEDGKPPAKDPPSKRAKTDYPTE